MDNYAGDSVLVWGEVSLGGRTDLYVLPHGILNAQRYRDDILYPIVRPYAAAIDNIFIFQTDNALSHTARLMQ